MLNTVPFNFMIRESAMKTDVLISAFKDAINGGIHPNDVRDYIFKTYQVKDTDLTDPDKLRLEREVEDYYYKHHSWRMPA